MTCFLAAPCPGAGLLAGGGFWAGVSELFLVPAIFPWATAVAWGAARDEKNPCPSYVPYCVGKQTGEGDSSPFLITKSESFMEHPPTVSPDQFGRDHLSCLLFIESCVVDNQGWLRNHAMRTNPRRHRTLVGDHQVALGCAGWKPEYSTRLASHSAATPRQVDSHDDWDCLGNMMSCGWVRLEDEKTPTAEHRERSAFGGARIRVSLTEEGFAAAALLRRLRARGSRLEGQDFLDELQGALATNP